MSVISQAYDRTGKGYLDETEKTMRKLDESGKGHLSNDAVYEILLESTKQTKQLATQRYLLIALGCFLSLLVAATAIGLTVHVITNAAKQRPAVSAPADYIVRLAPPPAGMEIDSSTVVVGIIEMVEGRADRCATNISQEGKGTCTDRENYMVQGAHSPSTAVTCIQ